MEASILTSTKKLLNIGPDDTSFDLDIITHINSAFSTLQQLGIGPNVGFVIEDDAAEWSDFLGTTAPLYILSAVKTNVGLRVRALFDPPQLPHVLSAMDRQLEQSDWRLNSMREETQWVDPSPAPILIPVDPDPADLDFDGGSA